MADKSEVEKGKALTAYASALLGRAALASQLGVSFGGNRDIYQDLGYKTNLEYEDYATQYERQDIAGAVINRPVDATWRGEFGIQESDDDNETALEMAWKELNQRLGLKSKFKRLDKLASLGHYGVLFLGLDDVASDMDFAHPVGNASELLYVKPLGEARAKVAEWDRNPSSDRYGLPEVYNLIITEPGGERTGASRPLRVHYTRVMHVTTELLESETYGVPNLQRVFNRLKDLEKIVGASAEMFWRNGIPGFHGKVEENATLSADAEEALKDQLQEYENHLRRFLLTEGIELNSLAAAMADPTGAVDVQIQMISAETGIPKRILTGSERGELASSEDRKNWLDYVQSRREEYAEICIVRPFVDRLLELGVLPEPKEEYSVRWEDLYAPSDKDKAEMGKTRSEILKNYSSAPAASDNMPLESFYRTLMNLSEEEIELIMEEREAAIQKEEQEAAELERQIMEEQQQANFPQNQPQQLPTQSPTVPVPPASPKE